MIMDKSTLFMETRSPYTSVLRNASTGMPDKIRIS